MPPPQMLRNAQILNDSCKVTVENIHRVTLTGEIHGDSTVKDGTDYRINLNDQHYDYEITAQDEWTERDG